MMKETAGMLRDSLLAVCYLLFLAFIKLILLPEITDRDFQFVVMAALSIFHIHRQR